MSTAFSDPPVRPQPVATHGWLLVPQEPTEAMVDAAMRDTTACDADFRDDDLRRDMRVGYRAMVATPPAAHAVEAPASFEVRVAGPDDIHRFADELAAHRLANSINTMYLADLLAHPGNEVLCVATVHPIAPKGRQP